MPREGNYGRWESYVAQNDPYGHQDRVQERLATRRLNEMIGQFNRSDRDRQHEEKLERWRRAEEERKAERDELGISEYQQQLAARGLVQNKIEHGLGETLDVQGFVDPETQAMMRELANQGLMSGKWVSNPKNRAAVRSLYERTKGESRETQAKAEREQAIAAQRAHEVKLREMELGAVNTREDRADKREETRYARDADIRRLQLEDAQRQRERDGVRQERQDAEYVAPADRTVMGDVERLRTQAMGGDVEAMIALKQLAQRRPDIVKRMGVDAEASRPTADKVVESPAIAKRLDQLRQMKLDGANPAQVKAVLDQLWKMAGESEFGPAVMEEAKAIIQGQLGKEWWLDEDERTIGSYVNDWWKQDR
jgi:hypothetical protein